MVKRGRAEDLGIRAREGRLRGSRRGQRLRLRERVAGKMELTSGVTLSAGRSGSEARVRATHRRGRPARGGASVLGRGRSGWSRVARRWARLGSLARYGRAGLARDEGKVTGRAVGKDWAEGRRSGMPVGKGESGPGWVAFWLRVGLGFGHSFSFLILFPITFLFLNQTKFEIKYKFEFKLHSNN